VVTSCLKKRVTSLIAFCHHFLQKITRFLGFCFEPAVIFHQNQIIEDNIVSNGPETTQHKRPVEEKLQVVFDVVENMEPF